MVVRGRVSVRIFWKPRSVTVLVAQSIYRRCLACLDGLASVAKTSPSTVSWYVQYICHSPVGYYRLYKSLSQLPKVPGSRK
ncbi:hypothetical protein K449DRAFT_202636 [Hypoxylon sp. EC38]|nr:hypothetical protein K449DRAFT_202636 [Hypoxylon sp. EC38]